MYLCRSILDPEPFTLLSLLIESTCAHAYKTQPLRLTRSLLVVDVVGLVHEQAMRAAEVVKLDLPVKMRIVEEDAIKLPSVLPGGCQLVLPKRVVNTLYGGEARFTMVV